jgi:hypothetical protein
MFKHDEFDVIVKSLEELLDIDRQGPLTNIHISDKALLEPPLFHKKSRWY